jgi:hypothetical protein
MRIQIIELVIQLSLQEGKQRKEYLMFRLDPVIVDMANTMYLDKNGKPVDCGYAMYASVGAFKMALIIVVSVNNLFYHLSPVKKLKRKIVFNSTIYTPSHDRDSSQYIFLEFFCLS